MKTKTGLVKYLASVGLEGLEFLVVHLFGTLNKLIYLLLRKEKFVLINKTNIYNSYILIANVGGQHLTHGFKDINSKKLKATKRNYCFKYKVLKTIKN